MKIKDIDKDKLTDVLNHWGTFDNAHFWIPPTDPVLRQAEGIRNSMWVAFKVDGELIEVSIAVLCVSKEYSIDRRVYEDGVLTPHGKQYLQKLIKHGEFDGD